MNEKLKELAEQSGFTYGEINGRINCFTKLERFAELIRAEEKPEWQELHKDEIKQIVNDGEEWTAIEFAQAVSDLLREKNA